MTAKEFATDLLANKQIGIIGYGNQGRAQALNLRDSGLSPLIGLRTNSASRQLAQADGFEVISPVDVVIKCDIVMLLIPDEAIADLYNNELSRHLTTATALGFAHGFAVHYQLLHTDNAGDVFMVSPKGTGEALRACYLNKQGLPSYVAVHQDRSQQTQALALAYAQAIGCNQSFVTTFKAETESDLFSEQAVLCGALPFLIKTAFEVLIEAGYDQRLVYHECVSEAKLVCDLLANKGLAGLRDKISNTAEFGGYLASDKILGTGVKERMQSLLKEIQSGKFAEEFIADYRSGFSRLNAYREQDRQHPLDNC